MDTLILITVDAQKREIAHRFEKNRNGTQIFAERPIILKQEGEHNTNKVIKRISGQEKPEHDLLQMCHPSETAQTLTSETEETLHSEGCPAFLFVASAADCRAESPAP